MTSNEHYRRAAALLSEVEQAVADEVDKDTEASFDAIKCWNDNIQRTLKIAELHMRIAEYKKD